MPGHEPIHTLPDAHLASFNTADQLYLRAEWPALQARVSPTTGFVHSGGLHAPVAGMTSAPFALDALTELGNRITADGAGGTVAINYTAMSATADDVAWVIATAATPDIAGNFHRVGSSNLMVNIIDTTRPALPANSVWLMRVTLTSSSIAAVQDLRVPSSYARFRVLDITDPLYGAVGDGLTDCSAAVQAACNAAWYMQAKVFVPRAQVGYLLDTTIDLTDLPLGLTIEGEGMQAPTFGAVLQPPTGCSVFLGNTGMGNAVFECLGTNNLLFRECGISSLGQDTPSQVGIVFGTSTTSPALQTPGGANCSLENVAIWLTDNINSVPLYFVAGAGLSHYVNLWTIGDFGVVLTADDALNYTPTYATIGAPIGVDGMHFAGCNLLGYGTQALVYLQDCHNMRFDQLYVATIFGGPGYVGQPYALFINEGTDIKIDVECDYFPSLLLSEGSLRSVHIQGSTYPNVTPIPAEKPIVAFFAGTSVINSSFRVEAVMGAVANYFFTTNGVTPTMHLFLNTDLQFDQTVSTNVFFGNVTALFGVPFFNLRFDGNADTSVVIAMNINGVPTTTAQKRYFLNGNKVGVA